jgi:outer membrane immunogenic protein
LVSQPQFEDDPTWGIFEAKPDFAGYLAGVQAGYNYQSGRFVWGVEGNVNLSNARGAEMAQNGFYGTGYYTDLEALGSLTMRLGYTWERALFYAKGGWAFGQIKEGEHLDPTQARDWPSTSTTRWANGWTLGGGMEFALTERWSAKAEYMHYDLGKQTYTVEPADAPYGQLQVDAATSGDSVLVGVNYHLGAPK